MKKKLFELEKQVNYAERYRTLCLQFQEVNYKSPNPKKADILALFKKLNYTVQYVTLDKLYIEKYLIGKYSFEYYYEFNGMSPSVLLYIKTESDWPLDRYCPGFITAKKLYHQEGGEELKGLVLFASTLKDLEVIFSALKPMLDDLRKAITPYLEKDQLDFVINEEDY